MTLLSNEGDPILIAPGIREIPPQIIFYAYLGLLGLTKGDDGKVYSHVGGVEEAWNWLHEQMAGQGYTSNIMRVAGLFDTPIAREALNEAGLVGNPSLYQDLDGRTILNEGAVINPVAWVVPNSVGVMGSFLGISGFKVFGVLQELRSYLYESKTITDAVLRKLFSGSSDGWGDYPHKLLTTSGLLEIFKQFFVPDNSVITDRNLTYTQEEAIRILGMLLDIDKLTTPSHPSGRVEVSHSSTDWSDDLSRHLSNTHLLFGARWWRRSPSTHSKQYRDSHLLEIASLLKELYRSGVVDMDMMDELAKVVWSSHVGAYQNARSKSYSSQKWSGYQGGVGLIDLMKMYEELQSQQENTHLALTLHPFLIGQEQEEPPFDEIIQGVHGFDPTQLLAPIAELAKHLMRNAGWRNVDALFERPFDLLKVLYFANQMPEFNDDLSNKGLDRMVRAINDFLKETIAGRAVFAAARMAEVYTASRRFHQLLQRSGFPLAAHEYGKNILLADVFPEQLILDQYRRRLAVLEPLLELIDETLNSNLEKLKKISSNILKSISKNSHDINPNYDLQGNSADNFIKDILSKADLLGLHQRIDSNIVEEDQLRELLVILIKELKNELAALDIMTEFNPEKVKKIRAIHGVISDLLLMAKDIYYDAEFDGGLEYSFLTKLINLTSDLLATANEKIRSSNLRLDQSRPIVILGENGQGKTTLLKTLLRILATDFGASVASRVVVPAGDFRILTYQDLVEVGKMNDLRDKGLSNFMAELKQLLPIFEAILSGSPIVLLGDELGKRTDQLNGMAFFATLLTIGAVRGSYIINSSHYNDIKTLMQPVFQELGLTALWSTMDEFSLRQLEEDEVPKSHAFEAAQPFIPPGINEVWSQLVQKTPDVSAGSEAIVRKDDEVWRESFSQLGWLTLDRYKGWRISGFVADVLGLSYSDKTAKHPIAAYDGLHEVIIRTILNPKWEKIDKVPDWLETFKNNAHDLEPLISPVRQIFGILLNIQDLRNNRRIKEEQRLELEKQIKEGFALLVENAPEMKEQLKSLEIKFPEIGAINLIEEIDHFIKIILSSKTDEGDLQLDNSIFNKFERAFGVITEIVIQLETLKIISKNSATLGMCATTKSDGGINLEGFYSSHLATASGYESRGNIVTNSQRLDWQSILITGPQGSGKTTSITGIAEALILGKLWGVALADKAELPENYEVLTFITVPDWEKNARSFREHRPFSGFESEVRNRLAVIEQFCERLKKGVKPVVVMDELAVSTNPSEAAEIIRAIKKYIEGKGGILILSTHNHQALWDMDRINPPEIYQALSVSPFWSEEPYQLILGDHGESHGIEAAEHVGWPKEVTELARIWRSYFSGVGGNSEISDLAIHECASNLRAHLSQFGLLPL